MKSKEIELPENDTLILVRKIHAVWVVIVLIIGLGIQIGVQIAWKNSIDGRINSLEDTHGDKRMTLLESQIQEIGSLRENQAISKSNQLIMQGKIDLILVRQDDQKEKLKEVSEKIDEIIDRRLR